MVNDYERLYDKATELRDALLGKGQLDPEKVSELHWLCLLVAFGSLVEWGWFDPPYPDTPFPP